MPIDTNEEVDFLHLINYISARIHANAVNKGFWEGERNNGELIALIHEEASELLGGLRASNPPSDHIPQFSAAEEEAADIVIRVMDMCAGRGWRLGEAILAKVEYNESRPHKHGKQF